MPRTSVPSRASGAELLPRHVQPMLATLVADLPGEESRYSIEYKWDGVRAIAYWNGKTWRLESRNLLDITARYPELDALAKELGPRRSAILDGEIIATDEQGRPSFPLLQHRMHVTNAAAVQRLMRQIPVQYFLFDLLFLDGQWLGERPLRERRQKLDSLRLSGNAWSVSPATVGSASAMLQTARLHGLEGIVAKRLDSVYEPGRRSWAWLKMKIVQRQEFVIGGWTPQVGASNRIGSLLIGYFDDPAATGGNHRQLHYAGSVGTGFTDRLHDELVQTLRPLTQAQSPFAERVPKSGTVFVRPTLVAEVEYRRWPAEGMVQQASFKGLRLDKAAADVVKEVARTADDLL